MIYNFTVLAPDGNYGKAVNAYFELVNDDDWVIIQDGDSMYTTKQWWNQVTEATKKGDAMFIAPTNRLGQQKMLAEGSDPNQHDMRENIKLGRSLYEKYGNTVEEYKGRYGEGGEIGGYWMMMTKKVWKKIGGFPNGLDKVDWEVHKRVQDTFPIYIIPGLYIYHARKL